jgi:DNA-binding transcriptional regulator YiaG
MKSGQLIDALKKSLGVATDQSLCRTLEVSGMTLHNWRQRKRLTPRIIAALVRRLTKKRPTGEAIVRETRKKLAVSSLTELAGELGITSQAIQNWKNRRSVTPRQIAGLIASTRVAVERQTHASSIRPLVEFFPISKAPSKQNAGFELFADRDLKQNKHPYLAGLKAELESHHGVYIFFDSRGQAIYSGKARKQKLWKELNLAFNRDRDSLQNIRRVKHPSRKQKYRTTEEKSRQITEYSVPLHELAAYFSAYDVADGMVDVVESLLVRGFANDLLNKRMERFGR